MIWKMHAPHPDDPTWALCGTDASGMPCIGEPADCKRCLAMLAARGAVTPSDVELRALSSKIRDNARSGLSDDAQDKIADLCDALLGEREAHSATKAENAQLKLAIEVARCFFNAQEMTGAALSVLSVLDHAAALASKESNSE